MKNTAGALKQVTNDKHGLIGIDVDEELTRLTQLVHVIKSGVLEASGSFVATLGVYGPEVVAWG